MQPGDAVLSVSFFFGLNWWPNIISLCMVPSCLTGQRFLPFSFCRTQVYVCVDVVCPYESKASGLHSRFTHCKGKMLGIFCEKKLGTKMTKATSQLTRIASGWSFLRICSAYCFEEIVRFHSIHVVVMATEVMWTCFVVSLLNGRPNTIWWGSI